MDKQVENEMETGILQGLKGYIYIYIHIYIYLSIYPSMSYSLNSLKGGNIGDYLKFRV